MRVATQAVHPAAAAPSHDGRVHAGRPGWLSRRGAIRDAHDAEALVFPREGGDVLPLDNMPMAHSRSPFAGARTVVVGMAESYGSGRGPS